MSSVPTTRPTTIAPKRPVPDAAKAAAKPRIKSGHSRHEHLCTRTGARKPAEGATMGYQQGFTSGPGV